MYSFISKPKNIIILLISAFAVLYYYFCNSHIGFGDALGFVWYVESGFELHTNANAHFAYNNLLRLLYLIIPWFSAFQIASIKHSFYCFCTHYTFFSL